jgi:hypothetical protein
MSVFEITMLFCFGVSWPISIAKALRTRVVAGKSPLFMAIVIAGYASGIIHQAFFPRLGNSALCAESGDGSD